MNNQSPLVPQGSLLEQKNKGRARVKIAVFFVLAIHGIGLLALLMQGCRRDEGGTPAAQTNTVSQPTFDPTNIVADTSAMVATQAIAAPLPPPLPPLPPAGAASDYKIVKGDTLGSVATHHKVTLKALMEANPGIDPLKLQINQAIHIPAPAPTPAPPSATGVTPDLVPGEQMYTVKSGDSLTVIAAAHHTTIKALRAANDLKTDAIKVGQKLKIPAGAPAPATGTAPATPR
jgi:peptidoglycan endopeptidase LytF